MNQQMPATGFNIWLKGFWPMFDDRVGGNRKDIYSE